MPREAPLDGRATESASIVRCDGSGGAGVVAAPDRAVTSGRSGPGRNEERVVDDVLVGVIMGSQSDWETMRHAVEILEELEIPCEKRIVSAHRTPERLFAYGEDAAERGVRVIIAGAGGAAHLPGMMASHTRIPVVGVPMQTKALSGVDSLYSIVQMPRGYPVATMAIGAPGAANGALFAAAILALGDAGIAERLERWRARLTASVAVEPTE